MPTTCWAPGCTSGYRSNNDKRHFFKVPSDSERLTAWKRHIPREGNLLTKHSLCDLHFEDQFLLKKYVHIINGEKVEMDRGKWELTKDAVPTLFPNLPKYLSSKAPKSRKRRTCVIQDVEAKANATIVAVTHDEQSNGIKSKYQRIESVDSVARLGRLNHAKVSCKSCRCRFGLQNDIYQLKRKVSRQQGRISKLNTQVKQLLLENRTLKRRLSSLDNLPSKTTVIIDQTLSNANVKSKHGNRYSTEWTLDALLIRCKSTKAYRMLRENQYLPLPSMSTLNRNIRALRPEFGFDKALLTGLKEKLAQFPLNERRGMLMFDEIQISKNIDFRVDSCKVVGMVDFGELTSEENCYQEGDHALVFLFQPHMGGWIQTIGCFCSASTTPTMILSKFILQAIILLENSGALVDGIVCDGASTNRSALTSFGFNGDMKNVQNKMPNPCDSQRSIFFFCDVPHLLKTIRNNLLKAREFLTPDGIVKLEHYAALLRNDLNSKTGLRAVPKLTEKHIHPNNFQKMSVSLAAQLFSKSTADGLELYQPHVDSLKDCNPTIAFTRTINDLFDLLNSRVPKDGIWMNSKQDKLKKLQETSKWLDTWESYVRTLPEHKQKLFLSRQTSQGLRVSLKSTFDLATILLSEGFSYVLTGKFCQDPLEMFFGIIRQSSGSDDHPSANQFLYVYRLLSVSNLVKPGKRTSVRCDASKILLTVQSVVPQPRIPFVPGIETLLDSILVEQSEENLLHHLPEHDYTKSTPEECIQFYLGGYVAHKLSKYTSCNDCVMSLSDAGNVSADSKLVELKTRGGLKLPSFALTSLIKLLETCFQKYSATPNTNMYFDILNEVLTCDTLCASAIGCKNHYCSLTSRCIHFYITTRLHFLKKSINRNRKTREQKHKLSKISKLT